MFSLVFSSVIQVYFSIMNHSRAVRAMNEALKQNRLIGEGENRPFAYASDDRHNVSDVQKSVCFHLYGFDVNIFT